MQCGPSQLTTPESKLLALPLARALFPWHVPLHCRQARDSQELRRYQRLGGADRTSESVVNAAVCTAASESAAIAAITAAAIAATVTTPDA
jgi:hypothetical protein